MPLSPDRRLRIRIAGALALVVIVNGLVLSVFAWSVRRVSAASGWSTSTEFGLPLTIGAVLLGAVGLVALQARYGSRTVIAGLDPDELDSERRRNVDGRVRRLAAQAAVPIPSVAVADRDEPGCLTVGSLRSPTIVVTTGLLERLDDDELEAALAHEVAHVANRDLPVVTAVAATVAIGDRLLERERKLRSTLWGMAVVALFTGIGLAVLAVPILALMVVYLVVSAVARGLLGVNAIALGLFAKTREYAADRGASELTGDPAALASALETLESERPTRDARLQASATLGIVSRALSFERDDDDEENWFDRWFVNQFSAETVEEEGPDDGAGYLDRVGERAKTWLRERIVAPVKTSVHRALAWRPPTHPPTEARIERLRTLERDRRG
ncbi:M48 family metallopeptidase [Natrinema amylolyticum]|uniref:M48 family metallopeptidase n=1 Tax=Natrinema amylolyticum TaxID=2878679 RepID=UPI001CFA4596|nr:M48 family metalloprotease [Natrinema amylolyticum]